MSTRWRPDRRCTDVASENGIVIRVLADLSSDKLWMAASALGSLGRQLVQSFSRFPIMFKAQLQMFVTCVGKRAWRVTLVSPTNPAPPISPS
jgi:hypothetical protein